MSNQPLITLRTAVLTLAYVHYYNTPFLPGRCLPAAHLRRLARWIGQPDETIRTLRAHKGLATHLLLLRAAGLLACDGRFWYCQPAVANWLPSPPTGQIEELLDATRQCCWTAVAAEMGLPDLLCPAHIAFVQQTLARQANRAGRQSTHPATWADITGEQWRICLPPSLPASLLFHLLQLGDWTPGQPLPITPLTIARAGRRGYALAVIEHTLTTATGQSLTASQQTQLLDWYRRAATYHLRPVYLLSTRRPEQLAAILENGRLRRRIHDQISPRHAIVSPGVIKPLQKWLAKRRQFLDAPQPETNAQAISPSAYHWLGLRLLAGLGQLIPLPISIPHSLLDDGEHG